MDIASTPAYFPTKMTDIYLDEEDVTFSRRIPASFILTELYGLTVIDADEAGNQAWTIPGDAAARGWKSDYFILEDGDAPWTGAVQFTTHILEDGSEVAVRRGEDILHEFNFPYLDAPLPSRELLAAWFPGKNAGRDADSLDSQPFPRPIDFIAKANSLRSLRSVAQPGAQAWDILDLDGAGPDTIDWATAVPASFILTGLYGYTPVGANSNLRIWQAPTGTDSAITTNVHGWNIEYAHNECGSGLKTPGLEAEGRPVSSYGLLLAATGSRAAAVEIMRAHPEPTEDLLEAIRAAR